jgi:DNA-binding helix-hairpin-helix protein with protein kinase domain
LFTAPEIQGRPFNNLTRTVEHDNFALAVILFQLLFMGRHPFAGRYEGPGEMPIEQAITEKRFPYGTKAARSQMKPPPGALSLSTMGDVAAQLFLDAFENTGPRPRAAQWVSGMQALKGRLVTCSVVTSHYYHSGQQQCPWCVYERTYNTTLFNTREYTSHKFYPFDVKTLWAEYHAVAQPVQTISYSNEPPSLNINAPMSKYVAKIKLVRKIHFAISAIVLIYAFNQSWISMNIIIIFIVFILIWFALNRLISTHRDNLSLQRVKKLNYYQKLFNSMSNDEEKKYALILKDCESMIKQIWNIPDRRNKALESLSKNEKQAQLEAYLSRFRIERANIPNIGSSLNATLASFGIETAADIQYAKVRAVPGFGDVRVRTLMEWRMAHELKFRYIPNDTSRDQEANKIDTYYHQKQEQLVKNVRSELMRAKALFNIIADNQNKMRRQLELALKEYQEADLKYRCDL